MYGNGSYKSNWNSIRLALLSAPKYAAVVNNFSGKLEEVQKELTEMGAFPISSLLTSSNAQCNVEQELPEYFCLFYCIAIQKISCCFRSFAVAEKDEPCPSTEVQPDDQSSNEFDYMPASRVVASKKPSEEKPKSVSHEARLFIHKDDFVPTIPEYLKVFIFPRGDISRFRAPRSDSAGLHGNR